MNASIGSLIIVSISFLVVGCANIAPDSNYADTFAVCENPGLDTTYSRFTDRSRGWGGNVAVGLPKGGGQLGAYRKRNDVDREFQNPERERYTSAVVDALHQDVVASCKAHMRCLSENGYIEGACYSTMSKWRRAEWELTSLTG